MASENNDQVLVEEKGSVGILTLNRPKQLNALSFQMISKLTTFFIAFEEATDVKLIILKGNGRAFSAGGDVSAVARDCINGHWSIGTHFFWNEFILNYIIATYSKPQVSIFNGFVFGGGAGLSIHGKFRVATENAVFAMPETGIGHFPDVGSTYFLSRLIGYFGEYVGLTGVKLVSSEMYACGLATHIVPSKDLLLLEEKLVEADSLDINVISTIIDSFSHVMIPLKQNSAYKMMNVINKCFSKATVEEIIDSLEHEAVNHPEEWIKNALQLLKKASPASLKICLRSIREARTEGIGECLKKEYRITSHILRNHVSKDYYEGVRALLLDKDKNPKWEPSRLELMTSEMVDRYFTKVDDPNWEDLRLPSRGILTKMGVISNL
ncbi:3-hydroxyisobutyryl-CoA hydrolase [Zostera marina]|uniref:3-hydroxyisobutyryl-CoA hydrolase n=1 Tax=Zostera marina TaxID=29655 RepID=A0A0K9NLB6_ZOSMR|nr:3-hydroxyisobutyryl-CoA hydrolase [Zostera marina]